jgi:hypothetical protein
LEALDLDESIQSIMGRIDDVKLWICLEMATDSLPHQRRVVDDQDPDVRTPRVEQRTRCPGGR